MRIFRKLLPHAGIILALMFITFFIVDKFNGAMNFINNDISKALLLLFALVSIANSCFVIHRPAGAGDAPRRPDGGISRRALGNPKRKSGRVTEWTWLSL